MEPTDIGPLHLKIIEQVSQQFSELSQRDYFKYIMNVLAKTIDLQTFINKFQKRMHSSKMCTIRFSGRLMGEAGVGVCLGGVSAQGVSA